MQLIDSLAAKFEPEKYRDEYQESMRAMIAAKQKGQEVTATVHPQRAPVIDLMDALRKSINAKPAASSKKPPLRVVRHPLRLVESRGRSKISRCDFEAGAVLRRGVHAAASRGLR